MSLAAAKDRVLAEMARLGHPIRASVEVVAQPLQPGHMGYTMPTARGYRVVVNAELDDARVESLLAHELSHVYRMDSGHPSHEDDAITAALASLPPGAQEHAYQRALVHHVINNVEDLYADDIAFRVMEDLGLIDKDELHETMVHWMRDAPDPADDAREARWQAAYAMANNARVLAQLRQRGDPLAVDDAQRAHAKLLAAIPADIAAHALWFQDLLENGLPMDTTVEAFTSTLTAYVRRFVSVADGR